MIIIIIIIINVFHSTSVCDVTVCFFLIQLHIVSVYWYCPSVFQWQICPAPSPPPYTLTLSEQFHRQWKTPHQTHPGAADPNHSLHNNNNSNNNNKNHRKKNFNKTINTKTKKKKKNKTKKKTKKKSFLSDYLSIISSSFDWSTPCVFQDVVVLFPIDFHSLSIVESILIQRAIICINVNLCLLLLLHHHLLLQLLPLLMLHIAPPPNSTFPLVIFRFY